MSSNKHFLVIGAGLSGCLVALQLHRKGQKVTLIDNGINHSSIIAAGMINPLVFRRMTKSWRLDEFTNYLSEFYSDLAKTTQSDFFHSVPIRRLFSSKQERDLWLEKEVLPEYSNYIYPITPEDDAYSKTLNDFGSGRVKNAYWVDTKLFLDGVKNYLAHHITLLQTSFDPNELSQTTYNGIAYSDVVFCEGYLGKNNPWFSYLPLSQTKGETLTITSDSIPNDESINRKCFVLPLGNNTFKVGSTYVWHTADTEITEEGKEQILANLRYMVDTPIDIIAQGAGVRPTTIDRRPLIGTHAQHHHYHIFNGLGTKGYMLAPLLSLEFANYLVNGATLNKEVNIIRFAENYPD